MKRLLLAVVAFGAIGFTGCAEFDGFYDDGSDSYKRANHIDRDQPTDVRVRSDEKSGAYGGTDVKR